MPGSSRGLLGFHFGGSVSDLEEAKKLQEQTGSSHMAIDPSKPTEALPDGFRSVVSSAIMAVKFEDCPDKGGDPCKPEEGHLEVIFPPNKGQAAQGLRLGSRWRYIGVPRATFEEMMKAPSIGKYFGANIRRGFEAAPVREEEADGHVSQP